ncbi:6-phosphogluconolactonase, eukaryotic type [hydrothermal vent metagenome]|uniref:6-phosphogluconolactonase, eukaryotic type n=1 Tax=hydrothermal vent metagenome TaxID=652676 RepID=A0A3B0YKW4_9ZZZZ
MHQWNSDDNFDRLSQAAANRIAECIVHALQEREVCHVILPGGATPAKTLALLAEKSLDWHRIHWYPGDERCCQPGLAERNDLMLQKNLWARLPQNSLNNKTIHPIPAELGAELAAETYYERIKDITRFDVAFLGMGEDGHTASLFPGNKALLDQRKIVPVFDSPKPPSERVSFSLAVLGLSRCKIVLASGKSKAAVIARIKMGENLPVNCLGDIHWYVDQDAMADC